MKFISELFWNYSENRLRGGYRIAVQFILFFAVFLLSSLITSDITDKVLQITVDEIIFSSLGIFTIYFAAKFLDKREFRSLGFAINRVWLKEFSSGLLIGGSAIIFVFIAEYFCGMIIIADYFVSASKQNIVHVMALRFIGYFFVALSEEAFSRGYHIKNIAESLTIGRIKKVHAVVIALVLSSLLFGFLHGANPNASLISSINLILIGLFYGYAYLLTGSLAMPIGIHFTWNFVQEAFFGFPVSGFKSSASIVKTEYVNGFELWNGGSFGPEAGLIILPSILLGILLLRFIVKKQSGSLELKTRLCDYN